MILDVLVWIGAGLFWTGVAMVMLASAIRDVRENRGSNGMLGIQRHSNVILFLIASAGLLAADVAGGLALYGRLHPEVVQYTRTATVVLIIVVLNAFGAVSLHLWITRHKLDAQWQREYEREQERKHAAASRSTDREQLAR